MDHCKKYFGALGILAIASTCLADALIIPVSQQAQEFGPTPIVEEAIPHQVPPAPVAQPHPIGEGVFPNHAVPPATVMAPPHSYVEEVFPAPVVHYDHPPAPLFTRVRYVDKREMHPHAVPKIIRVNDPMACKKSCGQECVYIQICVPPCDCSNIKCRRKGDRLRYDYGKYKVDIRIRKGFIVVDYQK